MIVNTESDWTPSQWRVERTPQGAQFIANDGTNNQTVWLQLSKAEAAAVARALMETTQADATWAVDVGTWAIRDPKAADATQPNF